MQKEYCFQALANYRVTPGPKCDDQHQVRASQTRAAWSVHIFPHSEQIPSGHGIQEIYKNTSEGIMQMMTNVH